MGYLHDVIAAESDLRSNYSRILEETEASFSKRADIFSGEVKEVIPIDENEKRIQKKREEREMTTTVKDRIEYTAQFAEKYLDAVLQKEEANQRAKADLIVDGTVLAKDIPVAFLLGLESKLRKLRQVFGMAPTLPSGIKLVPEHESDRVWQTATPIETVSTRKEPQSKILDKATPQHPAQIEKWFEDVIIAKIETTKRYGMLTSSKKAEILDRMDKLIQSTVIARQQANRIEIDNEQKIGKVIFSYIID